MNYNAKRYSKSIRWFGLQTKLNEDFIPGKGHFFPRKAIVTTFLGENIGYEKCGQRPSVIVSTETSNRSSGNVLIVPLTKESNKTRLLKSQYKLYKSDYQFLTYNSIVQCEDMRTISKHRIGNVIGFVNDSDMLQINKRLKFFLGL